jgi:prepilin-type N-terminal cleavage/methylation domain-containing protein
MKRVSSQSGFSLVELMVALVVTMIVTGSIFGLLTGGQEAFRKEPAMSDRQANIRAAMDMIVTDLSGAGAAMPRFAQVLAPGLNAPFGGPDAPGGGLTDELMILTDTGGGLPQPICDSGATKVGIAEDIAPVVVGQSFAIFLDDNRWAVRRATAVATGVATSGTCTGSHAVVTFAARAGEPLNVAGGVCGAGGVGTAAGGICSTLLTMSPARVVAYRIRYDATGVPFLERRTSDDWATWQQVFPGVEDLQVRYQNGSSVAVAAPADFLDDPGTVGVATAVAPTVPELDALVRRVEVTLGARALAANLTGQSTSVGAGNAARGQLRTITAMRPVLDTISLPGLPPPYPGRF